MPAPRPEIIAHRGLHEVARENTVDAFERAASVGASAIELDVHATSEGVVVVHHNFDIQSGNVPLPLKTATYEQARSAAIAQGFDLPKLTDVLNQFAGRLKVYIEVKAAGIELDVARIIRESECELAVHSFDHRIVKTIRDFVPGVQTGVLTVGRPVDPVSIIRAASATDYWPQVDFVDQDLVDSIHESRGRLIVWTANRPDQWERLTSFGVDGICTDRPDNLSEWQQSFSA